MASEPGSSAVSHAPASGYVVNNHVRNDVVAFWHAVYQASEGYEKRIHWTGNYKGNAGTTSAAFVQDVERRLNYFRAMCGVPSQARVNAGSTVVVNPEDPFKPSTATTKASAAQNAALMLSVNFNASNGTNPALSHNPSQGLKGWSSQGWNASAYGNLAFGVFGPGAITEYMIERFTNRSASSSWNTLVGHRRWSLYPRSTHFATGDQPGTSAYNPPTNVFYVIQKPEEMLPAEAPRFVAYPPAGYFPAKINSPYWSLACRGANFSSATVRMTNAAGATVPIKAIKRSNDYGDPAIIWEVPAVASVDQVFADTRFNVQVSGITGIAGVPSTCNYSVILINPDRILDSQTITGAAKVSAKGAAPVAFTPPPKSESLQIVTARVSSTAWKETAENAKTAKVIDHTAASYPLIAKASSFPGFGILSGKASFHLTFPVGYDMILRGVPEQMFELSRELLPKSGAKLTFMYRRGYMTKGSYLAVETSTNDGVSWKALGSPIRGVSDTKYDTKPSTSSRALPKSSVPVRVRFRYYTKGGAIYAHETSKTAPTGIFLDNITATKCNWLEIRKITTISPKTKSFVFNASSAGMTLSKGTQWHVRLRTKLGGKWFNRGPSKVISITS